MERTPFILSGITLVGIESVGAPRIRRRAAWARLARDIEPARLETIVTEVGRSEAIEAANSLLEGGVCCA